MHALLYVVLSDNSPEGTVIYAILSEIKTLRKLRTENASGG